MKKALLVLGGKKDSSQEFYVSKINKADYLVAVDSGANLLYELKILPDLLIGDMDSIEKNVLIWCNENSVETKVFDQKKDETDTELALNEIHKKGFREVQLLNALGDRPDHFLTTILLMYSYSKKMNIRIHSDKLISGVVSGSKELKAEPGELWSILPVGEKVPTVSLKGFEYEIKNKTMPFNKPYGTSNVARNNEVIIDTGKGAVIFFRWLDN